MNDYFIQILDSVEEVHIRHWIAEVRPEDVESQSFRRFIGHLHSVLQNGDGELIGRITGKPQPEIWVDLLRIKLLEKNKNENELDIPHKVELALRKKCTN